MIIKVYNEDKLKIETLSTDSYEAKDDTVYGYTRNYFRNMLGGKS